MSNIPSSAMPHAGGPKTDQNQKSDQNQQNSSGGEKSVISEHAGKIADLARENPKTAIAAGAAVVAGVVAAAATVRARKNSGETNDTGGAEKSTAPRSTTKKSS